MNEEEQARKMGQLVAKCWADEGFKQKLLADPAATLTSEGVELPAGLSIKAVENTDKVHHLVIQAKPTELSDEDLDQVVAAGCHVYVCAQQPKHPNPKPTLNTHMPGPWQT